VRLTASNLTTSYRLDRYTTPQPGRYFARVSVTIENLSRRDPLPVAFALFSLETDNGLVVNGSGDTHSIDPTCATTDLSVSAGGRLACVIVFEVPLRSLPRRLGYRDPSGMRTASVDVPVDPRAIAAERCLDARHGAAPSGSGDICQSCIRGCSPSRTRCTMDEGRCVAYALRATGDDACSSCELSAECAADLIDATDCMVAMCASSCG
jgi:hypothetical protein